MGTIAVETNRRATWPLVLLGTSALALVLLWAGYHLLREWQARTELAQAQEEIQRGALIEASQRLIALAASRPGALGGSVEYWLGVVEATLGDDSAAIAAFARVPPGYEFDSQGAFLEARANLKMGRFRRAARRLVGMLARKGPGLNPMRALLVRVLHAQARFADASPLLREMLDEVPKPVAVLREIWLHDQPAIPLNTLRTTLVQASKLAPDDDRVWLGLARLETATGSWDAAARWLTKCVESADGVDTPLWRAWLDWARSSDRPEEVLRALNQLGPDAMSPADQWKWRAWMLGRKGDHEAAAKALDALLEIEPNDRATLASLAEISARMGQADPAAQFRRQLAQADKALDDYRAALSGESAFADVSSRLAMGRLAEAAGRGADAHAWFTLAIKTDPRLSGASDALARLDRSGVSMPLASHPWANITAGFPIVEPLKASTPRFEDRARDSGLNFVYDNGASQIRQLPEPMGGGVALLDYDADGDLDLYVCHYCEWDSVHPLICRRGIQGTYTTCNPTQCKALPDHLFRNDGGKFTDVTAVAGIVDKDGRGLGVVAADLDDDSRIDLFVANDMSANFYWRNLGGLRFEQAALGAGVALAGEGGYRAGMGIACADLDGDGRLDLGVTNFFGESTSYYRSLGAGLFAECAQAAGIAVASRPLLGFGIAAFDADNDGRLDLATANGHVNDLRPDFSYLMPAQLLLNIGGSRFRDVSSQAGAPWNVLRMGRGLASGDLDNDGRTDLVIVSQNQPLAYLHNESVTTGRTLMLQLEGRKSNRDGVGARVRVTAGRGVSTAVRTGGGSYLSASDPRMHFGLGDASRVENLEVQWPSGQIDRLKDLEADAGYRIREGEPAPLPLPGFPRPAPKKVSPIEGSPPSGNHPGVSGIFISIAAPRCVALRALSRDENSAGHEDR